MVYETPLWCILLAFLLATSELPPAQAPLLLLLKLKKKKGKKKVRTGGGGPQPRDYTQRTMQGASYTHMRMRKLSTNGRLSRWYWRQGPWCWPWCRVESRGGQCLQRKATPLCRFHLHNKHMVVKKLRIMEVPVLFWVGARPLPPARGAGSSSSAPHETRQILTSLETIVDTDALYTRFTPPLNPMRVEVLRVEGATVERTPSVAVAICRKMICRDSL